MRSSFYVCFTLILSFCISHSLKSVPAQIYAYVVRYTLFALGFIFVLKLCLWSQYAIAFFIIVWLQYFVCMALCLFFWFQHIFLLSLWLWHKALSDTQQVVCLIMPYACVLVQLIFFCCIFCFYNCFAFIIWYRIFLLITIIAEDLNGRRPSPVPQVQSSASFDFIIPSIRQWH